MIEQEPFVVYAQQPNPENGLPVIDLPTEDHWLVRSHVSHEETLARSVVNQAKEAVSDISERMWGFADRMRKFGKGAVASAIGSYREHRADLARDDKMSAIFFGTDVNGVDSGYVAPRFQASATVAPSRATGNVYTGGRWFADRLVGEVNRDLAGHVSTRRIPHFTSRPKDLADYMATKHA